MYIKYTKIDYSEGPLSLSSRHIPCVHLGWMSQLVEESARWPIPPPPVCNVVTQDWHYQPVH